MKGPIQELAPLIGERGFRTGRDLEAFCLSIGLFRDEKADAAVPSRGWDPSEYNTWPLLQIIAHSRDPGIDDIEEIKRFLYPYFVGGARVVKEKIAGASGTLALERDFRHCFRLETYG